MPNYFDEIPEVGTPANLNNTGGILHSARHAQERTALNALDARAKTNADAIAALFTQIGADIATHAALTSGVHGITAMGATLTTAANQAAAQTALGLGTLATQSGTFSGTHSGTSSGVNTGDQTIPAAANPTGTVGLTAVNGSASTYLRSDGAPALSQAIVPTWTGAHTHTAAPIVRVSDAATNTVSTIFTLGHNSTGTPAQNFGSRFLWQLKTSTTADVFAGAVDVLWDVATHATRSSSLNVYAVSGGTTYAVAGFSPTVTNYLSDSVNFQPATGSLLAVNFGSGTYQAKMSASSSSAGMYVTDDGVDHRIGFSLYEFDSDHIDIYASTFGSPLQLVGVNVNSARRTLFALDAEDLATDPGANRFVSWDSGGTKLTYFSPPTITGSRGGNAALASLLTALATAGLVVDSTS